MDRDLGTQEPPLDDGSALADVVAVMDRLRSPGGCPWDREQTHASLVRYLLEEAHELAEAIETGDRAGLREELGDVLLQVVFHARIAEEDESDPFTIDDVAHDLVAKLRRRHPHVFAGAVVEDLHVQWDAIKQEEKQRTSVLDGIPASLGALAHAQKVLARTERAGLGRLGPGPSAHGTRDEPDGDLGRELLALVDRARRAGLDAEGALRGAVRDLSAAVREAERARPSDT